MDDELDGAIDKVTCTRGDQLLYMDHTKHVRDTTRERGKTANCLRLTYRESDSPQHGGSDAVAPHSTFEGQHNGASQQSILSTRR